MDLCSEEEYYHQLDKLVLTSCQQVRKVFINRWKAETGEDWTGDKEQVGQFLKGPGAKAFQKAELYQKNVLKNKRLEEWDIQLLFLVLQNFGGRDKYKEENDAVYNLKKMRNELAHHKTKKISRQEYDGKVADFKGSMKCLGMEDSLIVKMVEKVGMASSKRAAEAVERLHKKAEEFLKMEQFDKAMECLSEAVLMPSLLPEDLGRAFEKRAECWLNSVKDIVLDQDKCDRALLDAKRALKMNDLSWKAHHLTAQCYQQKNDLSKAKSHYDRALEISPGLKQVKRDLDSCKVLLGEQEREDHLCPRLMPCNLQETLSQVEQDTGFKLTEKEFILVNEAKELLCPGEKDQFHGRRYFNGWGVPQDFFKAFEYYKRAAAVKNAEGMYLLALCYYQGTGVRQDIPKALEILREVAAMPKNTKGDKTPLNCNVGVAWSEQALGLSYADGVGVKQDFKEAAKWYQRAMEDGSTTASNNLGLMYLQGRGVPKDEKMAEDCFKQGVTLKCTDAPASLVKIYINQMEPEKAEDMMRIGRQLDNDFLLRASQEQFAKLVAQIKLRRLQLEPGVLEFERVHQWTSTGWCFRDRLHRKLAYFDPNRKNLKAHLGLREPVPKSVLERKRYLQSPTRKALILEHRNTLKEPCLQDVCSQLSKSLPRRSTLKQPVPQKMSGAKPITLGDMDPTQDHVFEGRTLDLIILEEPKSDSAFIRVLAEDDNGDVTRLQIYKGKEAEENLENLQPGRRIGLLNPYMRMAAGDFGNAIRCEEARCIVYLEKVEKMCRFCGEGNAAEKCSKCKRPYCSRECQTLDWKMFQHKLICS